MFIDDFYYLILLSLLQFSKNKISLITNHTQQNAEAKMWEDI